MSRRPRGAGGLLIDQHMFDLDGRAKPPTLRKRILQWGPEVTLELAALREADFIGSGLLSLPIPTADRWRQTLASMEKEGAPFSIRELRVTGREIMEELGLPPGPQVGMVKQALWLHCAVRPSDNQKKRLLRLVPWHRPVPPWRGPAQLKKSPLTGAFTMLLIRPRLSTGRGGCSTHTHPRGRPPPGRWRWGRRWRSGSHAGSCRPAPPQSTG